MRSEGHCCTGGEERHSLSSYVQITIGFLRRIPKQKSRNASEEYREKYWEYIRGHWSKRGMKHDASEDDGWMDGSGQTDGRMDRKIGKDEKSVGWRGKEEMGRVFLKRFQWLAAAVVFVRVVNEARVYVVMCEMGNVMVVGYPIAVTRAPNQHTPSDQNLVWLVEKKMY